jgi:hypothetical protein
VESSSELYKLVLEGVYQKKMLDSTPQKLLLH